MLDWLPEAYLHLDASIYSGTKLIALPLILIDFFIYQKYYLKLNYGWLFVFTFLICVGSGAFYGTVSFSWFLQLLPICPILLFYQKPRDLKEIRIILVTAFSCTLLIPLTLILTYLGVIEASVIYQSTIQYREVYRISAVTSWSSTGLYFMFIPSSLAGILLARGSGRIKIIYYFLSAFVLLLSISGLLLTGLRSSVGSFLIALLISLLFYLHFKGQKNYIRVMSYIFFAFIVIYLFKAQITEIVQLNESRYTNIQNEKSAQYRIVQYSIFIKTLIGPAAS